MITIETTSQGIVWAFVKNVKLFGESEGKELSKKLAQKVVDHDELTIDLFGVEGFSEEGYREFSNLITLAIQENCVIAFSEVHDNLGEIIDSFTKTNES